MGEIDTSIVDVASVRLYWQKRSARYALSLLDTDVDLASTKVNDNDDVDSRASASATFTASSSSSMSSSAMPSEINLSLFDGFDGENSMGLMAVSSDDCSPRHSSTGTPPPPFQANDLSPIVRNRKNVKTPTRAKDTEIRAPLRVPVRGVQKWHDLQTDMSMDAEQNGNTCKVSSFCTATQTKLIHTRCDGKSKLRPKKNNGVACGAHSAAAFIPDERPGESDEENETSPRRSNKSLPMREQNLFKERPDLSCSNNTNAVMPRKYSIPTKSLLFERLERRVGKQVRNRAKQAGEVSCC